MGFPTFFEIHFLPIKLITTVMPNVGLALRIMKAGVLLQPTLTSYEIMVKHYTINPKIMFTVAVLT